MDKLEQEIWDFLQQHLQSIFTRDVETYKATTSATLSLYEWFISPHRMDGLDFHLFMIDHTWAGSGDYRYDLLEPRVQIFGADQATITAVVSYTFMLSVQTDAGLTHKTHNESRVLVKQNDQWNIVHVHKSPAGV